MGRSTALLSLAALMLFQRGRACAPVYAQGQPKPPPQDQQERVRQALVQIVIRPLERTGTAFCIDPAGWFVTEASVVNGLSLNAEVELIQHTFPSQTTKAFSARLVRISLDEHLALLKAENPPAMTALSLSPQPTTPSAVTGLIAYYPFEATVFAPRHVYEAPDVTGFQAVYPVFNGDTPVTLSLEYRAVLGAAGGPIVNQKGEVIGILGGVPTRFFRQNAYPMEYLKRLLSQPTFLFTPARETPDAVHDHSIEIYPPSTLPPNAQLTLTLDYLSPTPRIVPVTSLGSGRFQARTALLQPSVSDFPVRIRAIAENTSLTCRIKNVPVKIGEQTLTFDRIRRILLPEETTVQLRDGSVLRGKLSGLQAVPADLGNTRTRLNLTLFSEISLAEADPAAARNGYPIQLRTRSEKGELSCIVQNVPVRIGDKTVSLDRIQRITRRDETQVILRDGTVRRGKLSGLQAVPVSYGPATSRQDLTQFAEIAVQETISEADHVDYQITLRQANTTLAAAEGVVTFPEKAEDTPAQGEPPPSQTASVEKTTISLPSEAADIVVGGGGRYLLLWLPRVQKIAVFDVAKRQIGRYLSVGSENVQIAAGEEKCFVALPEKHLLQRWDLATGERELMVIMPQSGPTGAIAMGGATRGPLLIVAEGRIMFLDIQTLLPLELDFQGDSSGIGSNVHGPVQAVQVGLQSIVRASMDGHFFTAFPGEGPSRPMRLRLNGKVADSITESSIPSEYLLPAYDGSQIYTSAGIYSPDFKPIGPTTTELLHHIPSLDGSVYLRLDPKQNTSLNVYSAADRRLLLKLPPLENFKMAPFFGQDVLPVYRRLVYLSGTNLLVYVSDERNKLVIRPLDILKEMERSGQDYLWVRSLPPNSAVRGQRYTYTPDVRSRKGGVKIRLDSGPKGMTLSPEGQISWQVPADHPLSRETIILSIRDDSGQEIFHTFDLFLPGDKK